MEIYNSEEEQLEAIKRWWKSNGTAVIAGIVVGIIIILGWTFWKSHKTSQNLEASVLYQQLLAQSESDNPEDILAIGKEIISHYPDTPYRTLSALFVAKAQYEKSEPETALRTLQDALDEDPLDANHELLQVRIAQLLIELTRYEDALELIEDADIQPGYPFYSQLEELRGDALFYQGDSEEAGKVYRNALAAGNMSPFLQLKLDDISNQ